jgi:hypothetical protein
MNSGPAWIQWAALIGSGLLALAGIVLLVWALRGDRSRGRRRCPRCWYDMSGSLESLTCSECGHAARDDRQLYRPRRRWRWAIGACMLLLATASLVGWHQTRNVNWITVKPLWWLMLDADGPTKQAAEARDEISRRLANGLLSEGQIRKVVTHGLDVQADIQAFWRPKTIVTNWGDIIEQAWYDDLITDAELQRYARQAFEPSFFVETRAKVREGVLVPCQIGSLPSRSCWRFAVTSQSPLLLHAMCERKTLFESDTQVGFPFTVMLYSRSGDEGGGRHDRWRIGLPVGKHEVPIDFELAVFKSRPRQFPPIKQGARLADVPDAVVRWTTRVVLPIEVVPADHSTVQLVPDESLRRQITDAIQPEFVDKNIEISRTQYGGLNGMILVSPVPVNLSFDVLARVGDTEEHIGAIAVHANMSRITNAQRLHRHPREVFPGADKFDLILRSGPEGAEESMDIYEAWEGEIVIRDVPLTHSGDPSPATQPRTN